MNTQLKYKRVWL